MIAAIIITYIAIAGAVLPGVLRWMVKEGRLDTEGASNIELGMETSAAVIVAALWPLLLVVLALGRLTRYVAR